MSSAAVIVAFIQLMEKRSLAKKVSVSYCRIFLIFGCVHCTGFNGKFAFHLFNAQVFKTKNSETSY